MTREEVLIDIAERCGIDIDGNENVMVYDRDKMAKFKKWLFEELENADKEPCEDCISRQAVLAIAGDSCLDLDSYEDTKDFCDEINELPSVTPTPKWIPVSERLPKLRERVLCQCQANIYEVLKLTVDGWYHDQNHCYMDSFVIAWMPLPEPYKAERESEDEI